MPKKTVKLVGEKNNKRLEGFRKLINLNKELVEEETEIWSDYTIYFNLNHSEDFSEQLDDVAEVSDGSFNIVDISVDYFDDPKVGPYYVILAATADCLLTTDDCLQERIYNVTGRLAWVIKTEDRKPTDIREPEDLYIAEDSSLNILWFGKKRDYFTIVKELEKVRIVFEEDCSKRRLKQKIEMSDFVYLPPTFTQEQELERQEKAKLAVSLGVYPILDSSLTDFLKKVDSQKVKSEIKRLQKILETEFDPELNSKYLSKALSFALEDSYLKL